MRSGPVYERTRTAREPLEGSHCAYVVSHGGDRVKLHSRVSKYIEALLPEKFLDTLRSFTNQKMWDFMHLDNDGKRISEVIRNGTLDVAHDGSYQQEICKDICSTAVLV